MSIQKTYESVDTVDVMRISQELIIKNRIAYKHLALGIPIQQILDEIIPQLIKLYKGHVIQIVQFKNNLAYINLAVLFDDSYTLTMRNAKSEQEFRELLKQEHIDVVFRRNDTGRIYGVTLLALC